MKRKFEFSISTRYIGSEVKEEVELEFDDDATESEIDEIVSNAYQDWVNEHNNGSWFAIE